MDFKTLKYFITVVESGTISAAAKKLYMSQPPLSNQMYNLEEELGCTLFERTSRHIILTGAGKLLYDRAKILLNSLDAVKEEVSDFNKKHAGVIRIGMISSVAEAPLSAKIAAYAKANPSVILDIYECNTYQMIEMLHAKTLHLGIARTPFTANKFEKNYILRTDVQTVLCGAVSMGNPHCVVQVDNIETANVAELGPLLESHERFPERVNAGFMEVVNRNHIKLRVYERGAGETQACGSGACAAAAVGMMQGLLDNKVQVDLPGGSLLIEWEGVGSPLYMTGDATHIYDGNIHL